MTVPALYLRALRTQWLIVAMATLVGGAGLGLAASRKAPEYRVEIRLLVSFVPEQERSVSGLDGLMQRRVKTYASMMSSPRVTRPVIELLGLPYTPEQLGRRVVASSPLNSYAIEVAVTDTLPGRAADIATALAAELTEIAGRDKPSAQFPVIARISADGAVPDVGQLLPVRWQAHLVAGALAGLAIGLGLAVLRCHARDGLPIGTDLRNAWAAITRQRQSGHDIRSNAHGAEYT